MFLPPQLQTLFFISENSDCWQKCTVLPKRVHYFLKEKILLSICQLLQGDIKGGDLMT